MERPALKTLEALLANRRPPFQVLVISELSRLGREQYGTGGILKALRRAAVALHRMFSGILCPYGVTSPAGTTQGWPMPLARFYDRMAA